MILWTKRKVKTHILFYLLKTDHRPLRHSEWLRAISKPYWKTREVNSVWRSQDNNSLKANYWWASCSKIRVCGQNREVSCCLFFIKQTVIIPFLWQPYFYCHQWWTMVSTSLHYCGSSSFLSTINELKINFKKYIEFGLAGSLSLCI